MKKNPGIHIATAMLPAAFGLASVVGMPSSAPKTAAHAVGAAKQFSIPISNLSNWAGTVIVSINGVKIEGHSPVHAQNADCEMHLGAHTPVFNGAPNGLVLEPMNACVQPFPGQTSQSNTDWTSFGDALVNAAGTVTASGVPRIWPEHLVGGGASNPDHAVELHPLTALTDSNGKNFDFSANVFAGGFSGGLSQATAEKIVQQLAVSVTRNSGSVDISFTAGTIGNFTVLNITIERDSIASDGAGSFSMDGEVSSVPVRIVTAKGSPINDEVQRFKSGPNDKITMDALVLFSLSPQALLDAANKSHGDSVAVEHPIQLILYGTPDDQ